MCSTVGNLRYWYTSREPDAVAESVLECAATLQGAPTKRQKVEEAANTLSGKVDAVSALLDRRMSDQAHTQRICRGLLLKVLALGGHDPVAIIKEVEEKDKADFIQLLRRQFEKEQEGMFAEYVKKNGFTG